MTQLNLSVPIDKASDYRGMDIPTNIIPLISDTNYAQDCFVNQRFSSGLQTYLINYVLHTNSFYDIPG